MSKIRELIKSNSSKALGTQFSSSMAFQIHLVRIGLEIAGEFSSLLERGVVALEAVARQTGAKLPADEVKAQRKAEAQAKLAELERQKVELERAAASEED